MNSITDEKLAGAFGPLKEVTTVVDGEGRILGYFTPTNKLTADQLRACSEAIPKRKRKSTNRRQKKGK